MDDVTKRHAEPRARQAGFVSDDVTREVIDVGVVLGLRIAEYPQVVGRRDRRVLQGDIPVTRAGRSPEIRQANRTDGEPVIRRLDHEGRQVAVRARREDETPPGVRPGERTALPHPHVGNAGLARLPAAVAIAVDEGDALDPGPRRGKRHRHHGRSIVFQIHSL